MLIADFGTDIVLANNAIIAVLAAPSTGGAATRTFSIGPSGVSTQPSIRSRPPRGVSRIRMRTPSLFSENRRGNIVAQQVLQEEDRNDHDHRCEVDPAEIGQHPP